ncbi:MAG: SRPBCC family protein [Myxococcota bacterium]
MSVLPRLLAFVSVSGLGASLLPRELDVTRSAVVSGTPDQIRPYIVNYPQRQQWIAWVETDPKTTYDYAGTPGTLGSTMSWTGGNSGTATLTMEEITSNRVVSRLDYHSPVPMQTQDIFVLDDLGDGTTRVTWSNRGPVGVGSGAIFALFADRIVGPDYALGLERLSQLNKD